VIWRGQAGIWATPPDDSYAEALIEASGTGSEFEIVPGVCSEEKRPHAVMLRLEAVTFQASPLMRLPRFVIVFLNWLTVSLGVRAADGFVRISGKQFVVNGRPLYICGTNLWYGAYLGRPSNPAGRERLLRELDRLRDLGVNNLRVLGAVEECDTRSALHPAIQSSPGVCNEDVLQGLDFLVQEAGRRNMKLVVFLNNYWDWSGGMPQYLAWANGGAAPTLDRNSWPEYNRILSTFYTNPAAQTLYRRYVAVLLDRTNTLTGRKYRDEPAIMSWELANEPRPGEREGENDAVFAKFLTWVEEISAYIHSLDPQHLVTTGSEGNMGCLNSDENFRRVHAVPTIDYAVFHLWPNNWGWYKRTEFATTIGVTLEKARDYATRHIAVADAIGKPVVIEEFGLDRDGGLGVEFPTTSRDKLYSELLAMIEVSAARGGAAAGSDFWLWGGEGRPPHTAVDSSDGIGAGEMPQEAPGLNTVFDCDQSTLTILRGHFAKMLKISEDSPRRIAR
jgi:mannan endo-1,4-beta-mannosidase